MTRPSSNAESIEVVKGIGTLFLYHLAVGATYTLFFYLSAYVPFILFQIARAVFVFAIAAIGLFQLAYAIPLYRRFRRQRRPAAAKGVVIGAIITVLLDGSCFLVALWFISQWYG